MSWRILPGLRFHRNSFSVGSCTKSCRKFPKMISNGCYNRRMSLIQVAFLHPLTVRVERHLPKNAKVSDITFPDFYSWRLVWLFFLSLFWSEPRYTSIFLNNGMPGGLYWVEPERVSCFFHCFSFLYLEKWRTKRWWRSSVFQLYLCSLAGLSFMDCFIWTV